MEPVTVLDETTLTITHNDEVLTLAPPEDPTALPEFRTFLHELATQCTSLCDPTSPNESGTQQH